MYEYGVDTIDWDEFRKNGVPDILYKYRTLSDKFQRKALYSTSLMTWKLIYVDFFLRKPFIDRHFEKPTK